MLGILGPLILSTMPASPQLEMRVREFPARVGLPEPLYRLEKARAVFLLVDFDDNPHTHPPASFSSLFGPEGLFARYFKEVSYHQFEVVGEVFGWFRAPKPYSFYTGDSFGIWGRYPRNAQGLVEAVVRIADPEVDFSRYDLDRDGKVDGLFVVHSGPGAEETGDPAHIWSHKWALSDPSLGSPGPYLTQDGVRVDAYAMGPEERRDGTLIGIGVFCHEYGHLLGLPDLYDRRNPGYYGLGHFCLMATGGWAGDPPGSKPVHLSSFCKYLLGWVEPVGLERGKLDSLIQTQLPAAAFTPGVYRLLENPGGADWTPDGKGQGEYFLVENRYQIGFDQSLLGSGLLILHVDERMRNNDDPNHPLVGVVQADSDPSPSLRNLGEPTDLWADDELGFWPGSIPPSSLYDGRPSGVVVNQISRADSVMTASLKLGVVMLDRLYSFPNPCVGRNRVSIRYEPSHPSRATAPKFKVSIYNLAGELIRVLDDPAEVSPLGRTALWDLKNEHGEEVASGLYFYLVELEGEVVERRKGRLTLIR